MSQVSWLTLDKIKEKKHESSIMIYYVNYETNYLYTCQE